jgi:DNA-binding NarL/FixJ family response regulator
MSKQVDKLVGDCKDDRRLWGTAADWTPLRIQILTLRVAGWSIRAIATQLNIPWTTVRSTLSAFTRQLRAGLTADEAA